MISFAITTHNEGEYIRDLLDQLIPFCEESGDEIVIVDDNSTDELTNQILNKSLSISTKIQIHQHTLNNNFAEHKNFLNNKCKEDYIFQIDADEIFHLNLLHNIYWLVDNNDIDLFFVPRVNVVTGLTDEDIKLWNWNVNELGWVQWPDYQTRLYKNKPYIRWEGKVHERIVGHKTQTALPALEEWALYHIKDVTRQRQQNKFYSTL